MTDDQILKLRRMALEELAAAFERYTARVFAGDFITGLDRNESKQIRLILLMALEHCAKAQEKALHENTPPYNDKEWNANAGLREITARLQELEQLYRTSNEMNRG